MPEPAGKFSPATRQQWQPRDKPGTKEWRDAMASIGEFDSDGDEVRQCSGMDAELLGGLGLVAFVPQRTVRAKLLQDHAACAVCLAGRGRQGGG